ncbi:IS3 family transposase [Arthrobacter sp. TB 23]|uniref:IS3 family transposase n=2 Tax=Arthrobacter sp. TB 23 TaxID=494419 RepID=UPI0012E9EAD8|nr:IS3 family transposase [Arthrobacter sp. TB 23]
MPKAFPEEFRRDVIAVARKGEAPITQIAKDFGVSPAALHRWLKIADREDGVNPGAVSDDSVKLREANKRIRLLEQEAEVMRRAVAYLSRDINPKMMYPLVRELAAQDAPVRVPVAVSCRVLNFSRQAYYLWAANPISARDWEEAHLINAAIDHHRDDPAFGYRFIADEINASAQVVSERRIWRLCSANGILSVIHRRRRSGIKTGPPVHDDLIDRDFTAAASNQKWLTDITEHPTDEGKLYLCAIKDLHSNRIVGYSMDGRMKASLAVAALDHAVSFRKPAGTVVHSDRGSQFRSRKFVSALHVYGLSGSMGRVGACGDNAAMESFFSLLQKNVLNRKRWETRAELRLAITTWIERTYHRKRRQRTLGRLTPIEFETINNAVTAA